MFFWKISLAIIGILAAVLLPVLAAAREQARVSKCIAQLKQVGIAMSMYVNNYDNYLPYNVEHTPEDERQESSTAVIWRGSSDLHIGQRLPGRGARPCWGGTSPGRRSPVSKLAAVFDPATSSYGVSDRYWVGRRRDPTRRVRPGAAVRKGSAARQSRLFLRAD